MFANKRYHIMFGLFKRDPSARLNRKYAKLMEEATVLQRQGNIKGYATKVAEAEALLESGKQK